MLWRSWRRKEQPNWGERQGNYPMTHRTDGERVWFHAVSVGEVLAAVPILRELKALRPDDEIVLSVTTSSGHQAARELPKELIAEVVYFPIDVKRFQLAAMQQVRPAAVAIMETELWMNFLWAAKVFDAQTLLVNGRISDRSFRRGLPFKAFYSALLRRMDRCLMQTGADRDRLVALGAKSAEVFGNCKFDQAMDGVSADPSSWRATLGIPEGKPVVVIGSTRGDLEERMVVDAISKVGIEHAYVVHAPRHLERVAALAELVRSAFGAVALRSKGESGPYLILDTYGELASVYGIADVVVVGGGFDNLGGQNIVQPMAHGKPVIHGPHMQNFRQVALIAREAGATRVCSNAAEIATSIVAFLEDPDSRSEAGDAGRDLVEQNVGASKRYAEAIAAAVAESIRTR